MESGPVVARDRLPRRESEAQVSKVESPWSIVSICRIRPMMKRWGCRTWPASVLAATRRRS